MKNLIFLTLLLCSSLALASPITTNPSSTQTIAPAASGVIPLQIDTTTSSSVERALDVKSASTSNAAGYFNNSGYDALDANCSASGCAGVYGHGYFAGVYGESDHGYSGYFEANTTNAGPTLVTQQFSTSTQDLFQALDWSNNVLASIDYLGVIHASKGLQLPSDSSTTCSASTEFRTRGVPGGTGVADQFQVCLKDASDNYSWVTK